MHPTLTSRGQACLLWFGLDSERCHCSVQSAESLLQDEPTHTWTLSHRQYDGVIVDIGGPLVRGNTTAPSPRWLSRSHLARLVQALKPGGVLITNVLGACDLVYRATNAFGQTLDTNLALKCIGAEQNTIMVGWNAKKKDRGGTFKPRALGTRWSDCARQSIQAICVVPMAVEKFTH